MEHKNILWALGAPLAIILFLAIPYIEDPVGAWVRILAYLILLGGASSALAGYAALKDNHAPRPVLIAYALMLMLGAASFVVWLLAPLWEGPIALGWGLGAMQTYALSCLIIGIIGIIGYKTTRR